MHVIYEALKKTDGEKLIVVGDLPCCAAESASRPEPRRAAPGFAWRGETVIR